MKLPNPNVRIEPFCEDIYQYKPYLRALERMARYMNWAPNSFFPSIVRKNGNMLFNASDLQENTTTFLFT